MVNIPPGTLLYKYPRSDLQDNYPLLVYGSRSSVCWGVRWMPQPTTPPELLADITPRHIQP